MKDVPYASQIKAICDATHQRNLDIDKVGDYYKTWREAARQAYPDPKIPDVYHDFLAERVTWRHFFPTDKFPGKNPLYDCLMSALDDLEKVTERHIKKEDDGVDFKVAQLQEVIQQKELLIKNKDELLGLRKEALLAAKDLLAQKDKIIRFREDDIQHTTILNSAREQIITEKDEIIRNREDDLQQAQLTITAHEQTIAQKSEAVKNAKQPRKELYIQLAKKDKVIESHKEYIERQKQTIERLNEALRVKGIKNKELDERWVNKVAELKNEILGKNFEIGALKTKLEICVSDRVARTPKMEETSSFFKMEGISNVKDEGSEDEELLSSRVKVKTEPMDY